MRAFCERAGSATAAPALARRLVASRRLLISTPRPETRRLYRPIGAKHKPRPCRGAARIPRRSAQVSALCNSSPMPAATVRAACPHDCPDTCAMRVTVVDGRAVRVQGDPDHPPTHGALCTKVSRYAERTHHPDRVLHPLKRVGPKGAGRFTRVGWDEALDDIAARLKAIAAARCRGHRPVQLRRHDGPAAGREHGGALLPPPRRVAARPHDLLVGRRRGAGRDLRRQDRHARRALRREPPDRDLGQQLDHLEPAFLDPRAGRQARRRQARLHRPAAHRDRREVPSSTSR